MFARTWDMGPVCRMLVYTDICVLCMLRYSVQYIFTAFHHEKNSSTFFLIHIIFCIHFYWFFTVAVIVIGHTVMHGWRIPIRAIAEFVLEQSHSVYYYPINTDQKLLKSLSSSWLWKFLGCSYELWWFLEIVQWPQSMLSYHFHKPNRFGLINDTHLWLPYNVFCHYHKLEWQNAWKEVK